MGPKALHAVAGLPFAVATLLHLGTAGALLEQGRVGLQRIAFQSNRSGTMQIHLMNADGSGVVQLTSGPGTAVAPQFSPDGTRIVFASNRDGRSRVYVMNGDGSGQRRLTTSADTESEPTWSADGCNVYHRVERGEGSSVVSVVDVDGGAVHAVTDAARRYMRGQESPDGRRVLLSVLQSGIEVHLMNRGGGGPRRIPGPAASVAVPSWSPDGGSVLYARVTPPPAVSGDVHVMRADGTGDRPLTTGQGVSEYPCWSPDGSQIAFQTDRDGNFEVYLMRADGTSPQRLTNSPGFDGRPSWGRAASRR